MENLEREGNTVRLYTKYYLCKSYRENFNNVRAVQTQPNRDEYRVDAWGEIKRAIDNLYAIDVLQDLLKKAYSLVPTPYKYLDFVEFNRVTWEKFSQSINDIKVSMDTIIKLYESMGHEASENDLEIQIPENIELSKFGKMIDDLNFVLKQCPIIERDEKTSRLLRTDVGSLWLVLAGSYAFLKGVGYIVQAAVKARADLASIRQLEALTREMEGKAELVIQMNEIINDKRKLILNKYVAEIQEVVEKKLEPSDEQTLVKCLEKMDELLESGLKVYAAIDTPREIQILFPEQPELKGLPVNPIELITKKDDE